MSSPTFRRIAQRVIPAAVLLACAMAGSASAGVLFDESFTGGTQAVAATGDLPGTVFTVASGNVDLYNYYGGRGLNLDLLGNGGGGGAVTTKPLFNLTAGNSYVLDFTTYSTPFGNEVNQFDVSLGSFSQHVVVSNSFTPASASISFTALANQSQVSLRLAGVGAGTEGPKFQRIALSEVIGVPSPIPEPATAASMLAGLAVVASLMQRRQAR